MSLEFAAPSKGAQYMRERDFYVFPLIPNGKTPTHKNWQEESRTFEDGTISSYVMGHGNEESNFGVHPPDGFFVVDIDNKGDKKGSDTWADLESKHGRCPDTLTVRTPTGGLHKYFRGQGRNSVGAIGRGIDTRARGGYVVAPGSLIDGKRYEIIDASEVAYAPEWLIGAMAKVPAPIREVVAEVPLDLPGNVETAIEYLQNAEPAVEGVNGDNMLFQIFAKLKDLGISRDQARELVLEHYNDRCDPPWDMDNDDHAAHFDQKLAQGWKTKNSPGSDTPEARIASATEDFAREALPPVAEVPKTKIASLPLLSAADIIDSEIPKRNWIIDGFLLGSFLSITGAPGGTGKSNFEIRKALAVVTGKNLLGDKNPVTKRGPVVLYNGEDPLDEMKRRVAAFRQELGLSAEETRDLYLVSGRDHPLIVAGVDRSGEVVLHKKSIEVLLATVKSVGALVLSVDPLVRTHHLNENDNMAMDKVTQAFQWISSATGCSVSVVHHTNKAALNPNNRRDDSASQAVFRGAGSLVASARVGHVLTTMNAEEAKRMSVPPEKRRYYFKVENAKANLSAPAEWADWYESRGVEISNGEKIGICRRVDLVAQPGVTEFDREEIIEFLNRHMGAKDELSAKALREIAISENRNFAIKTGRTEEFVENVEMALGSNSGFKAEQPQGKSRPWLIRRTSPGATAPTEAETLFS